MNRENNSFRLRTAVMLLAVLMSALSPLTARADGLSGQGTKESPYLISSKADWDTFASNINAGTNAAAYYKLGDEWDNSSSAITTMVGTKAHPFAGHFDGNGKTLTVALTSTATGSDDDVQGVAPFHYIGGATIEKLTVAGTISSKSYHTAGVVGFAADGTTNTIEGCTVTATLNIGTDYAGGIIGHGKTSATTIKDCTFEGLFKGDGVTPKTIGGIWGWDNTGCKPTLINCLENGTYTLVNLMHPIGYSNKNTCSISKCYYVSDIGTFASNSISGAAQVSTKATSEKVNQKLTLFGNTYYLPCEISGMKYVYKRYDGDSDINPTVKNNAGETLTLGTDFTAKLNDTEIKSLPYTITKQGEYTLTISGTGSYTGTQSFTITATAALSGEGTAESPYLISNATAWDAFAKDINEGINVDAYYKLSDDWDNSSSAVTTMVGTETHPFAGHFNGNKKTLHVALESTATGYGFSIEGVAPFHLIGGATIENLTVAGSISSASGSTAGIVGIAYFMSTNLIKGCTVTATLNISSNWAGGGIIGDATVSTTTIENCTFAGTFNGVGQSTNIGGIWGYSDKGSTAIIKNCLENGKYINIETMHPMGLTKGTATIESTYFVNPQIGSPDNVFTGNGFLQVYTSVPDGELCQQLKLVDNNTYYLPCTVSGVETLYERYDGKSDISITPTVKTADGNTTLVLGTDFTAKLNDTEVTSLPITISKQGDYTLAITGTGSYTGTKSLTFTVTGTLHGEGTSEKPYLISSTADWEAFVKDITGSDSYSGEYVKLASDISVTTMAGTTDDTRFCGTFDGGGHTITATIDRGGEDAVAVFRSIGSATIRNLTVAGSIKGKRHVAGLVGTSFGAANVIEDCKVTANITCTEQISGGIVGHGKSGGITIQRCTFSGLLTGATRCMGAIYAWADGAADGCVRSIKDCLYLMQDGQPTDKLDLVYLANGVAEFPVTNCYKTCDAGKWGTRVYTSAPDGNISQQLTLIDNNTYYLPCTVSGVETLYERYDGKSDISITPTVKTADGNTTLVLSTDFTAKLNDTEVTSLPITISKQGDYTLAITGTGSYAGTKSLTFTVTGTLHGEGTSEKPYIISSAADWDAFAKDINAGINADAYYKLSDDWDNSSSAVTTTVGTDTHRFAGHFDGNGKTLTVALKSTATGTSWAAEGVAPFHFIGGATIENLTVAGTITSASWHTAGIVGFAADNTTNLIKGCTVNATLNIGNDYAGGIIGHALKSTTTIENCTFAGIFNGGSKQRANIGGIWGWNNEGCTPKLINCLENGQYNNIKSMHPMGLMSGTGSIENSYFVNPQKGSPKNACTLSGFYQVSIDMPSEGIAKKMTNADTDYYAACNISNVQPSYYHTGSAITLAYTVTGVDGKELTEGTDYTVEFSATPKDCGDYTVTFKAKDGNANGYTGSQRFSFNVKMNVTLGNTADNRNAISTAEASGYPCDVTLGRTFVKDGTWQSLCLPFDLTLSGSPLDGAVARTLGSSTFDPATKELTLTFGSPVAKLTAGTPYLIKWTADGSSLENPVFTDVTVKTATADVTTGKATFKGTYAPVSVKAAETEAYLGANNTLSYNQDFTVEALQGYFSLNPGSTILPEVIKFNFGSGSADNLSFSSDQNVIKNTKADIKTLADNYDTRIKTLEANVANGTYGPLSSKVTTSLNETIKPAIQTARAANGTSSEMKEAYSTLQALNTELTALEKTAANEYVPQAAAYKAIYDVINTIDIEATKTATQTADPACTYYTGRLNGHYTEQLEKLKKDVDNETDWRGKQVVWTDQAQALKTEIDGVPALAAANLEAYNKQNEAYNTAVTAYYAARTSVSSKPESEDRDKHLAALDTYKDMFDSQKATADKEYQEGKSASNGIAGILTTLTGTMNADVAKWSGEGYDEDTDKANKVAYEAVLAADQQAQATYAAVKKAIDAYSGMKSTEMKAVAEAASNATGTTTLDAYSQQLKDCREEADKAYTSTTSPNKYDGDTYVARFKELEGLMNTYKESFVNAAKKAIDEKVDASITSYKTIIKESKTRAYNYSPRINEPLTDATIAPLYLSVDGILTSIQDAKTVYDVAALDAALLAAEDAKSGIQAGVKTAERNLALPVLQMLLKQAELLKDYLTAEQTTQKDAISTALADEAKADSNVARFAEMRKQLTDMIMATMAAQTTDTDIKAAKDALAKVQENLYAAYQTVDGYAAGQDVKPILDKIQQDFTAIGEITRANAKETKDKAARELQARIDQAVTTDLLEAELNAVNKLLEQEKEVYNKYKELGYVEDDEWFNQCIDQAEKRIEAAEAKAETDIPGALTDLKELESFLAADLSRMKEKIDNKSNADIAKELTALIEAEAASIEADWEKYADEVKADATLKNYKNLARQAIDYAKKYVSDNAAHISVYEDAAKTKIEDIKTLHAMIKERAAEVEKSYQESGFEQMLKDTEAMVANTTSLVQNLSSELDAYGAKNTYKNKVEQFTTFAGQLKTGWADLQKFMENRPYTDKLIILKGFYDENKNTLTSMEADCTATLEAAKNAYVAKTTDALTSKLDGVTYDEKQLTSAERTTLNKMKADILTAISNLSATARSQATAKEVKSAIFYGTPSRSDIEQMITERNDYLQALAKKNEVKGHIIPGKETIDSEDMMALMDIILNNKEAEADLDCCDIDGDGEITITDLVYLRYRVVHGEWPTPADLSARSMRGDETSMNAMSAGTANDISHVAINLDNLLDYQALQIDIHLPEGAILRGKQLGERVEGANLIATDKTTGTIRIIILSTGENIISGTEGTVIYLDVEHLRGNVTVSNVILTDTEFRSHRLGDAPTAIDSLKDATKADGRTIYSLGGKKMEGLQKGVNIIRNADGTTKKVVVK